jgi:hypothetical protein
MGDPDGGDIHDVFQAPVLFRIPEVTLDLEASPIVIHEWRLGQFQITAEQNAMNAGLGLEGGFGDDDDLQWWRKLLVKPFRLVQLGLDVSRHGGRFEELAREIVVIHLVARLAMGATPGIGATGGEVQGRIAAPRGNPRQVALPSHRQGMVVPQMTVQHPVCPRDISGDQFQEGVPHGAHVQ